MCVLYLDVLDLGASVVPVGMYCSWVRCVMHGGVCVVPEML